MSGPIIVKLGGDIAVNPPAALLTSIVEIAAERSVVVVHGGGTLVDHTLALLGKTVKKIDGLRVTPADQIDTVAGVLAGTVNAGLVAALSAHDGRPVGLTLGDGALGAVCRVVQKSDGRLGCVGEPEEHVVGDGSLLHAMHAGGWLPVVACVGSRDASLLNVNADDAAAGIARVVGASVVVLLTDVAGVLDAEGAVIAELDSPSAEALIERGVVRDGMTPKVRAAVRVADSSGCRVVIGMASDLEQLVDHKPGRGTVFRPTQQPSSC